MKPQTALNSFVIACLLSFVTGWGSTVSASTVADSLSNHAALLAARGNVAELRPLYEQCGADFPRSVRLYCELALARADHRWQRSVACIDTIVAEYENMVGLRGRLSLSILKAEILRRMGHYDELVAYCDDELRYYRRRSVKSALLVPFQNLRKKGQQLCGSGERNRALALADRDEAFGLSQLLSTSTIRLDDYARWRCGLTLAVASHREKAAWNCADSLLSYCPDSLDTEDKQLCTHVAARALTMLGAWETLGSFCQRIALAGYDNLISTSRYRLLAQTLSDFQPTTFFQPKQGCDIQITAIYPPIVQCTINQNAKHSFNFDTGTSQTIIAAVDAREAALRLVPDTLEIATSMGLLRCQPAVLPHLSLGELEWTNLLVYVALDDNEIPVENVRTLGLSALSHISQFTLYSEKIVVPAAGQMPQSEGVMSNLRFSALGDLLLRLDLEERPQLFLCNTMAVANVLSPATFPVDADSVANVSFCMNGQRLAPMSVLRSSLAINGYGGMLGFPFLRNAESVTFDFDRLSLTLDREPTAAQATDTGGYFFYRRNLPAYQRTLSMTDSPQSFNVALTLAQDHPDVVVALTNAPLPDAMNNAESESRMMQQAMRKARLSALVQLGAYAQAAALADSLQQATRNKAATDLLNISRHLKTFPAHLAPAGSIVGETHLPYTDASNLAVVATMGVKETDIIPDLTLPKEIPLMLSEKAAKRLKVTIYAKDKTHGIAYGIIDKILLGNAEARHVFCLVKKSLPAATPVHYGVGLLRLFPVVAFTKDGLDIAQDFSSLRQSTPSEEQGIQDKLGGAPFTLSPLLQVEGETATGYEPLQLTTAKHNASSATATTSMPKLSIVAQDIPVSLISPARQSALASVSINDLLMHVGNVFFNFKTLQMFIVND